MRVAAARVLAVLALLGIGALFLGIAILGFVDPAGMKMADDGDPFGPSSRADALLPMLLGAASVLLGWRLARRKPTQ
jgi:hypothetical protein